MHWAALVLSWRQAGSAADLATLPWLCRDLSWSTRGGTVLGSLVTRIDKESCSLLQGESIKAAGKGRSSHRARNKRGSRARASKDTSKLLLLYDEDILDRDPLREQKDLAFAQAYLTRVGNCCHLPVCEHLELPLWRKML